MTAQEDFNTTVDALVDLLDGDDRYIDDMTLAEFAGTVLPLQVEGIVQERIAGIRDLVESMDPNNALKIRGLIE
jgi:hypothetical protein